MPNSDTRTIIFYGADESAKRYLEHSEANGVVPVCFVDRNTAKHHTGFCGYDILALDEATERYRDYELYIAVKSLPLMDVVQFLIESGVPQERIKNISGKKLYYGLGCKFLGRGVYSAWDIHTCAVPGKSGTIFGVALNYDIDELYRQYRNRTNDVIADNRAGKATMCGNCHNLQMNWWEEEPQITDVGIASGPNDFCNSKCVYCVKYPLASKEEIAKRESYILEFLKYFIKHSNGEYLMLHINAGELSVSSYCDEVMELIRSNENVRVYFSSNAIVYKQSIADMLKTGRGKIIISPDAGTPETIAKVRGFDCFDATIGNAKKYAEALPNKLFLSLKYILLEGVNDNENDIRKFLNIVKEIGCTALLSSNLFELAKGGLSERSMELCRLFMRICKENDLVFRFVDYYFADKDRVAIESYKAELDLCR